MASTIGLTGLLSSDDSDTSKDLYRLLETTTDPFTATVTDTNGIVATPAFASTNPVAVDQTAGINAWTASFSGRYPKNAPALGHQGLVTFASGYVIKCTGWSMTLSAGSYPDTGQASTPPTWEEFLPGEISATGSFTCAIDDTTATSPAGTAGAATFRLNTDSTDNTLAGNIILGSVGHTVARGAKNIVNQSFTVDGNLTSAGTLALFAAGALATPDLTDIVLRAAGDIDYTGSAFWTSLTINCQIGSPIEVSGTLQGSGALTRGS